MTPPQATPAGVALSDVCEHCGNRYDKAFAVVQGGWSHVLDSFECAIHAMAPRRAHCNGPIIGHGVKARGRIIGCARRTARQGITGLVDRTGPHV